MWSGVDLRLYGAGGLKVVWGRLKWVLFKLIMAGVVGCGYM